MDRRSRLHDRHGAAVWIDLRALAVIERTKRWTPEDDERIRAFVAQGASLTRAAAALKRKRNSVAGRARKIGCPFPTLVVARKKWAGKSIDVIEG
jgi:hypothetical protein